MLKCLKCGEQTPLDIDDPDAACVHCGAIHDRVVRVLAERRRAANEAAAKAARRERRLRPWRAVQTWLSSPSAARTATPNTGTRMAPGAKLTLKTAGWGLGAVMAALLVGCARLLSRKAPRERVNRLFGGGRRTRINQKPDDYLYED